LQFVTDRLLSMLKILVTGGAGYIGSTLVPDLLSKGHQVTVIDNFMYGQTSLAPYTRNKKLKLILGDIRDEKLLEENLKQPDIVIPLAAIVGAPACERDPVAATSVNKTALLWMLKKISKDQHIIMPTTNSAYGKGNDHNFCDENSPLNPLSLYAKDKVAVEEALLNQGGNTSFRLATVFGMSNRMRIDLLVNNFVHRAITDGFLVIFEGNFKRNYIHILDVVQAFNLAIENPNKFKDQIFNVGLSEANISKLELCAEIKKKLPNFVYLEAAVGSDPDQRNYIVSNKKIESFGFIPEYSLQDGIDELIKGLVMFNQRPYTNI
jgi:nucleoside-diphosphate-sugar epimerase